MVTLCPGSTSPRRCQVIQTSLVTYRGGKPEFFFFLFVRLLQSATENSFLPAGSLRREPTVFSPNEGDQNQDR